MPTYKTLYKGQFKNIETDSDNANNQKDIEVLIYDTDSGAGAVETTIDLEMTGEPTIFETIDNSENKFTVLKPKKAEVKIYSSDSVKIETFGGGGDQRFYEEVYYDSVLKFAGWLSTSDLRQDFMPNPNEITLVATCGLNLLSNIPLVDFDGVNPTYEHRVIEFLAWALSKTGHQLNIVASFNIRERYAVTLNQDGHSPLTAAAIFAVSPQRIRVTLADSVWFYVGQRFTTASAGGNTGPFTVTSMVETVPGNIDVFTLEPLIGFSAPAAVFTDLAETGDGHFFKHEWLFAKGLEDDINTCVDCGKVIEIILGRMAYITQRNGTWFINLIDDIETGRGFYLFTFDYQGNFVSKTTADIDKSIGVDQLITWSNDDQSKSLENAVKSVELNFNLETPKETLTNYDFSRGTVVSDTRIDPEGWKLERNYPVLAETVTDGYIKLELVDGDEVARYLFIDSSATNFYHAFRNLDRMYLEAGDKLQVSIDWKHTVNEGGSGHYRLPVAMIRLWADDGTHWHLNMVGGYGSSEPQTYWIQSNAAWTTNARYLYHEGEFNQDDLTQWQTASATSAPCPKKGRIEVFFVHNFKSDTRGKCFGAVSFDIIPYVAGTYAKYKAHQYKVSQDLATVQLIKDDVGIATTIKRYLKRALLKVSGLNEIYTGVVTISGTNSISFASGSGYLNYLLAVGKKITTTGTNIGYYTVESIIYHTVGNNTEIIIKENNLTSQTTSMTINEILFDLASEFYAAAAYPDGLPDTSYKTYGHLQIIDVWNQNNRVMAKFEGTIDHFDPDSDIPDISHKYFLTDADLSTNGKIFMALHLRNDLHNVESNIFLHEVADENIGKVYPEPDSKYIT